MSPLAPAPTPSPAATGEPPRLKIVARAGRLVMFHRPAGTPDFWDAHWLTAPPRSGRPDPIHPYFRAFFTRHLPRRGLILEAGCGNGNVARSLAGAGYQVEGLDFAPAVIERSRQIDPRGRYVVGDVRSLPHDDDALAGYISLGVVEHFEDDTRAGILAEARRALRPGGVAIITVPYYSPLRRLHVRSGGFPDGPIPEGLDFYQYYMTARDLGRQLASAGFRPIATDAYDIYKGIKDTVGHKAELNSIRDASPEGAALLECPPRKVRLYCGHMLMMAAVKAA